MSYTTPRGTRDFSPIEMAKRNFIFNTIKEIFIKFGFQQIETPAMEYLTTLLGKYGEEGDKLIFKILNSGNFLKDIPEDILKNKDDYNKLSLLICEKGLRYDLTVPFARYIVEHYNDIIFPFKRFQIQPVWRADRPQKGRYREFYQCDADIVGSNSLLNELELLMLIDEVFQNLNINIKILINNRKILTGIIEYLEYKENAVNIISIIDKFEKIGKEKIIQELEEFLKPSQIEKLFEILEYQGDNFSKLFFLKDNFKSINNEIGLKGVEELLTLLNYIEKLENNLKTKTIFDLKLARGLDYYTGTILEVKTTDIEIGSICAGGRYDNLTGIFGKPGLSGVGISFGADRIYDVMEKCGLFPVSIEKPTQILFLNFGEEEAIYSLKIINSLRKEGIAAELYPDHVKVKKQMSYANQKNVKYVAIIGSEEISQDKVTLRNMLTGEQIAIPKENFIAILKEKINNE